MLCVRTLGHKVKLFEAVGHGQKFESKNLKAAILEGKNDTLFFILTGLIHAQSRLLNNELTDWKKKLLPAIFITIILS